MAAWLAYLKSRLLLPEPAPGDGPSAEDMATRARLAAAPAGGDPRSCEQLMERPQLDRDVFPRGVPEPIADIKQPEWTATLYDLLSAYAKQRAAERARRTCASSSAPSGRWPKRARRSSG